MRVTNFLRILLLALALAAYSKWLLVVRPVGPRSLSVPAVSDGLPLLDLDAARNLWSGPGTVFLDVRPAEEFRVGHIRGAINVPGEDLEKQLPRLRPALERASALVVYCKNRDCGKSLWAAIALRNAGLLQTWIYPGGWNEWVNAEQPVTRGR